MRGNIGAVDEALGGIRVGLQADGYDIEVIDAAQDRLGLRIVALEGACEDCLSPPSVMAMVVSGSLDGAYAPDELDITYPAEAH
ncbi:MAG: NifU family protein [Acidimicrobiia bacterium]|nr:NifU family protein [Acidimicrobiia bacterium]